MCHNTTCYSGTYEKWNKTFAVILKLANNNDELPFKEKKTIDNSQRAGVERTETATVYIRFLRPYPCHDSWSRGNK